MQKVIIVDKQHVDELTSLLNDGWCISNTIVFPGVAHGGNAWDGHAEVYLSYNIVILSRELSYDRHS